MTAIVKQHSAEVVNEGCGAVLLAAVYGWSGDLITQATVASIAYQVLDVDDSDRVVLSGSLAAADVVFNSEQTDGSWPYTASGYNFRWLIPAAAFDTGGHAFRVEVTITPAGTDAEPFAIDRLYVAEDRH